ncbi:hypothetical protein MANES_04G103100v8 [Manihot esculenta]|uniref:EF-hand domain-containing protein n=1 Tax=Manihot esculenta TaxID=3983 RepID=A0A2C9W170_MANES|nr:hypothetical protein MANES_04G103100v8 [Manihot esculenta]
MFYSRHYSEDYNFSAYHSPSHQPMYEERPPMFYDKVNSFHPPSHHPMYEEKPSMCIDRPAAGAFWGSSPAVSQDVWFPSNPPPPPPPRSYHIPSNPHRVNNYKSSPVPLTEDQVRQIFMKFDLNGDNVLSREEIRQAFNYLGAMFPAQKARQGIKLADGNGDGVVDMSEMEDLVKYAYNLGYVVR